MKTVYIILVISILSSAINIYGQTDSEYNARAFQKSRNMDYKGAISDYTQAILLDEKNNMINYLLVGELKEKLNDYYGAISAYDKIINYKSNAKNFTDSICEKINLHGAYARRGKLKNILKDYKGAISDLTKAIEFMNDDYESYSERGDAKFSLKDYRGAIVDYDICIEDNIKTKNYDGTIYCNRGLAKINLGRKEEGCLDLSKAGELGCDYAYEVIKEECQN